MPHGGHYGRRQQQDAELRQWIDAARRGSVHAAMEAMRVMRELGKFKDRRRPEIRRLVGGFLGGCDPDVVSEAWARFVAAGGLR